MNEHRKYSKFFFNALWLETYRIFLSLSACLQGFSVEQVNLGVVSWFPQSYSQSLTAIV
jgi:hypothetical protein